MGMKEINISLKMIEAGIKCIFGEQGTKEILTAFDLMSTLHIFIPTLF